MTSARRRPRFYNTVQANYAKVCPKELISIGMGLSEPVPTFSQIGTTMRSWRLILGLVVAGGALAYWGFAGGFFAPRAPAGPKQAAPGIPVIVSTARRADVPMFLTGLGTVQAFNSVLVKSRVDGQIIKIHFLEGKDVKAGDLLVEIDPAPFEAALAQANANKLKDEAQLVKARLDLDRARQLATSGSGSQQCLTCTSQQSASATSVPSLPSSTAAHRDDPLQGDLQQRK
jgi:membrane fusion protein, multidrug efflux system